jgi:dTDP-4-amino-4,6-dideoxy-D-galactose acyltransferase
MKPSSIEKLEWDSQLFGYPVAKVDLFDVTLSETNILFKIIKSAKYRLCYLFVNPDDLILNRFIVENGGILVDRKTILYKRAENHNVYSNEIIEYTLENVDDKIKELALIAGCFSRFKLDRNFKNNEFEKLYFHWVSKSITKEIAIKTFITKENSNITGMITLGGKDNSSKIGLLAVNDNFHGRKIGTDLVRRADSDAYSHGFKTIHVISQFDNTAALKLYEKCNFKIENIINVYHLWSSQ